MPLKPTTSLALTVATLVALLGAITVEAQDELRWLSLDHVRINGAGLTVGQARRDYLVFEPRARSCFAELARREPGRQHRIRFSVEVAADGTSQLRDSVPEPNARMRACLEPRIRGGLRFAADADRGATTVWFVVSFGGRGAAPPPGTRVATRCDGAMRRATLPLVACGEGDPAPDAVRDELSRMLDHASARATPRYPGNHEGRTISFSVRDVGAWDVRVQPRERIVALRYTTVLSTQRGAESMPLPPDERTVSCVTVRFVGPPGRAQLEVPTCLPGFSSELFPLTRRRRTSGRGGAGQSSAGGVEPFVPASVDLRE